MQILYFEKRIIMALKKFFTEYRFWFTTIILSLSSGILFAQFAIDPYTSLKEHKPNTFIVADDVNVNFKIMAARLQKIESRMLELTDMSAKGEPVGSIISYSGNFDKVPEGWLLCDGRALQIPSSENDEYYELYNVVGTSWGTGTGSQFRIPNLLGYFLKGADDLPGVYQNDNFQGHHHKTNLSFAATFQYCKNHKGASTIINGGNYLIPATPKNDGSHGIPRISSESRPRNTSVYYLIKYKSV